jgi:hypothetical protein
LEANVHRLNGETEEASQELLAQLARYKDLEQHIIIAIDHINNSKQKAQKIQQDLSDLKNPSTRREPPTASADHRSYEETTDTERQYCAHLQSALQGRSHTPQTRDTSDRELQTPKIEEVEEDLSEAPPTQSVLHSGADREAR